MRSKATSQKKPVMIIWIIKTPIRALSKAKSFYVKGITNFSTSYNRPMMIMEEANRTTMQLPRSFSTTMLPSHNEPHQPTGGLIRASSSSGTTEISMADIERYMVQKQQQQELQLSASTKKVVPRSCSVGMGRIDEDRVSSFRNENMISEKKVVVRDNGSRFSRNRSHDRDSRRS